MTSLSRHQSCVWIYYVGGNNHAADVVSSATALALVTNMRDKCKSTSLSTIQVKNQRKTISIEEKFDVTSGFITFFTPQRTHNFIKLLTSTIFSLTFNILILFLV